MIRLLIAALCLLSLAAPAVAQTRCSPDMGRKFEVLTGEVGDREDYRFPVGPGWTFALVPEPHGWMLRVFDEAGMDLTQLTPPYRGAPNPREIFGWHFRNAANTGSNDGSVNAPQLARRFVISPALTGTGGFKPSAADADPAGFADQGQGTLHILSYALADTQPGKQARMTAMAFELCLSWPESLEAPPAPADTVLWTRAVDRVRRCGLPKSVRPEPWLKPEALISDFDGDFTQEVTVPIVRTKDGKRGLAICIGGRLHLVGLDKAIDDLEPAYFEKVDGWVLVPAGPVNPGPEGKPPVLQGQAILLAKDDSSSVMLYWDGRRFRAYWQGD